MTNWTPHQQAEHRAALCEALRSGRYVRTEGSLRLSLDDEISYCVWGVACDVSGLGEWDEYGSDAGHIAYTYRTDLTDITPPEGATHPPQDVTYYYGMGIVVGGLIYRNDDEGMPFDELADLIEVWGKELTWDEEPTND